ncbi:MAG: hypothetical protein CMH70_08305 [Nitrosomonadaceae bacterium]|nr:hypothetical protein [Nitrosomonadaceae bacterium]|tara:strand:- start:131 stop:412 length:282 start_codon:yes stop_codon:yes gene_type:complete
MNVEKLCLEIAKVEDGTQVIDILKSYDLWEDEEYWVPVGSKIGEKFDLNNHATIGNQQSNPSNALVEKQIQPLQSSIPQRVNNPMPLRKHFYH